MPEYLGTTTPLCSESMGNNNNKNKSFSSPPLRPAAPTPGSSHSVALSSLGSVCYVGIVGLNVARATMARVTGGIAFASAGLFNNNTGDDRAKEVPRPAAPSGAAWDALDVARCSNSSSNNKSSSSNNPGTDRPKRVPRPAALSRAGMEAPVTRTGPNNGPVDPSDSLPDLVPGANDFGLVSVLRFLDGSVREVRKIRFLGQGAFGKVTLVESRLPGASWETAALKEMLGDGDEDEVRRHAHWWPYDEEVRNLATLRQRVGDRVLGMQWHGATQSHRYIALDFMAGGALDGALRSAGRMPVPRSLKILEDALVALVGLHEAGGIHRDLKPANILLRQKAPQSAAVIGDWGLTYWGEGGAGVKTTGGCGTAAYMAPEMWEAGGEYGAAVDIFALGATVFELVTAQRLFWQHGDTVGDTGCRIAAGIPDWFWDFGTWESPAGGALARLIVGMVDADPTKRPAARALLGRVRFLMGKYPCAHDDTWPHLLAPAAQPIPAAPDVPGAPPAAPAPVGPVRPIAAPRLVPRKRPPPMVVAPPPPPAPATVVVAPRRIARKRVPVVDLAAVVPAPAPAAVAVVVAAAIPLPDSAADLSAGPCVPAASAAPLVAVSPATVPLPESALSVVAALPSPPPAEAHPLVDVQGATPVAGPIVTATPKPAAREFVTFYSPEQLCESEFEFTSFELGVGRWMRDGFPSLGGEIATPPTASATPLVAPTSRPPPTTRPPSRLVGSENGVVVVTPLASSPTSEPELKEPRALSKRAALKAKVKGGKEKVKAFGRRALKLLKL